jgi:hypothetical protein
VIWPDCPLNPYHRRHCVTCEHVQAVESIPSTRMPCRCLEQHSLRCTCPATTVINRQQPTQHNSVVGHNKTKSLGHGIQIHAYGARVPLSASDVLMMNRPSCCCKHSLQATACQRSKAMVSNRCKKRQYKHAVPCEIVTSYAAAAPQCNTC